MIAHLLLLDVVGELLPFVRSCVSVPRLVTMQEGEVVAFFKPSNDFGLCKIIYYIVNIIILLV